MSNKAKKTLIVIGLSAAIAAVVLAKHLRYKADLETAENDVKVVNDSALPVLVDLGADKCVPCKMMKPILEELKAELTGVLKVEFIDVWKNPEAAGEYRIRVIPTQIFYDSSGKELFRHEGFFSKEDILNKFKELGVDLTKRK
jgi:thioredoxin 1